VLIALVSGLVAIISPFWGMIFWTVNICDLLRKRTKEANVSFLLFGGAVIIASAIIRPDTLRVADVLIGVGAATYLFANLYTTLGFKNSFTIYALFQCLYGFGRKYIFPEAIGQQKEMMIEQLNLSKNLIQDSNLMQNFAELESTYLEAINIYFNHIEIVWFLPIIFALVIGIVFSRKNPIPKIETLAYKLPDSFVYIMIIGMVLAIFKQTRFIGMPITVTFAVLLIIQGFPIVWFWLLGSTLNNTLLRILTYIVILLNFHIFLIISCVVGLIDIWFNLKNGVLK